jgi:hypothetical protein
MDREAASRIQSAEARRGGGAVEKGSFAARAQVRAGRGCRRLRRWPPCVLLTGGRLYTRLSPWDACYLIRAEHFDSRLARRCSRPAALPPWLQSSAERNEADCSKGSE